MTATLIDSNVLLDVMTNDPTWFTWSNSMINRAGFLGDLCINPIIYAEVSVGFERLEELEIALPDRTYKRLDLPKEAAFLAGKAFLDYRRRGGLRTATLPDFIIGAHAAVLGMNLLTRDAARVRTYFPTVTLISP